MRDWERLRYHGPWSAAVKGSSALRAAVITACRDEAAHYNCKNIRKVLLGL